MFTAAVACAGVAIVGCKSASPAAENGFVPNPNLTLEEFKAKVSARTNLVLDARNFDDYRHGHVPGAVNLPVWNFTDNYAKLDHIFQQHQDDMLIVYCSSRWCDAADELQLKLIALGHKRVALFPGGWAAWQEAKLPEERSN